MLGLALLRGVRSSKERYRENSVEGGALFRGVEGGESERSPRWLVRGGGSWAGHRRGSKL